MEVDTGAAYFLTSEATFKELWPGPEPGEAVHLLRRNH